MLKICGQTYFAKLLYKFYIVVTIRQNSRKPKKHFTLRIYYKFLLPLLIQKNYCAFSKSLQKKREGKVGLGDIFTLKSLFDGVAVVFKKRENGLR